MPLHSQPSQVVEAVGTRVYALGRFQVEVGGAPLRFAGREPGRPLALLKVLVGLGGRAVPAEALCDWLWPDAEGDAAARALSVNLVRLRRLIGSDTVRRHNGRVSLVAEACWVDAFHLDALLERARIQWAAGDPVGAAATLDEALTLYQGPLLDGESGPPPVLAARERLQVRLREQVEQVGRHLEAVDPETALSLYRRGLACDALAEPLYLGLLRTCLSTGQHAEGLAAYRRCEEALRAGLDAVPSPAVQEAYQGLRAAAETNATAEPDLPVVAVLAFDNLGGDPAQDYLGDGLADSIITALARLPQLRVAARHSAFAYKGRDVDVRRIGAELGVAYVLEGGVLRSGERLRITAQLIDARTGHHLWAESYDRAAGDLLAVLDDITHRIVVEMGVSLVFGEYLRHTARSTQNLDAFDRFLAGMWHFHRFEPQSNRMARQRMLEALVLDPAFARAMAVVGYTYLNEPLFNWSDDVEGAFRTAETWAKRSLEADPDCALGLSLQARLLAHRHDYAGAIALNERMIALEPGNLNHVAIVALTLVFAGRLEEGLAAAQRALQMGPRPDPVALYVVAEAQFLLGRDEDARRSYERLIRVTSEHSEHAHNARKKLIAIHMRAGREAEARALAAKVLALRPDFSLATARKVHLRWPHRDYAWYDAYEDHLRRAGLPD